MKMKFPAPAGALICLLLALALPGQAGAAATNIAQVPLLNINGTGSVKPNLMLLFDNSGSMDQAYTPDYVNDNLCRTGATLANGVTSCTVGYPPFMSPDFNKQYYNPAIQYAPPVMADGTYYPSMTAANTVNWTSVTGDGFGAHKNDMFGNTISSGSNLVSGFPDLKWCTSSTGTSCMFNTSSYSFPDSTYRSPVAITGNPYYYTIGVALYCSDSKMTNCVSTAVGAVAPSGFPVPAKVLWCTTTALTSCQGKRVANYVYPKYASPVASVVAFGTIAIGASVTPSSLQITGVTLTNLSGTAITLTNGAQTAGSGTDTALKQQTLASALAASIIGQFLTGQTTQYWACVRTPFGQSTVAACSTYGINLSGDNVVAVFPVTCTGSTKSASQCTVLADGSRNGWTLAAAATSVATTQVPAAPPSTALITVSGTGNSNSSSTLASVTYNGTTLAQNIVFAKRASAATAASGIVSAINSAAVLSYVKAYIGGNTVTPLCASKSSATVCLVDTNARSNGLAVSTGAITPSGLSFSSVNGAGYVIGKDTIPIVTTPITGGSTAATTFARTDIVPGRNAYPISSNRSDCVTTAGTCTYAEEMTNFANWYAYYKTRLQMMKSSIGVAFAPLTGSYRVGLARLSVVGTYGAIDIKPIDFTGTARSTWYTTLYNVTTSGSTPTRPAMDAVGRMYANQSPYNYSAGNEVVQYPCQQNFMILTTDGYWNGSSASNVLNNDNVNNPARFCTTAGGCVDTRAQSQPSISDVSLYWYNGGSNTGTVSLRPVLEPNMNVAGQVGAANGENTHLHMTTFTLGLGVDGIMNYEQNYDTAPIVGGDFYNLISGTPSGCPWNSNGAYVWPDPDVTNTASTVQERVDDLWHAAVNGHGKYFSASDPNQVVAGLSAAITKLQQTTGAAAAAATSTPNISQEDNDIFSDTFTTVSWYGELTDKKIDPVTGSVGTTPVWISSQKLAPMVSAASDSRTIYMLDTSAAAPAMKYFLFSTMTATEQAWFSNKCVTLALSQCTMLSASDRTVANSGANMVNWLRGQQQYANNAIYRAYGVTPAAGSSPGVVAVLGDIVSSQPAYLRDPRKSYTLAGYADYKTAQAARAPVVFTAANDGMLHAFNAAGDATGGNELWGYAPRITMAKLYAQASTTYATNHQFTTDGSPELGDVQINGVWKTVLVAGLNAGGRGYYALDVTDPANPLPLWEFCADSSICSLHDDDLGLTFGNPQFGMWNGHWAVYLTSGYNNIPGTSGVAAGGGQGYLYIVDVATGAVLEKIGTGSGNTTTPSGLAKITAISLNPQTDPVTTYVYGGDNQGQLWRFDLTTANPSALLMGNASTTQPITTRPDVTTCMVNPVAADGTALPATIQRVVVVGTGRLLDVPDVSDTDVQSLYGLKDSGTSIVNIHGGNVVQQTLSLVGSASNTSTYTVTNNPVDLSTKDGWYVDWSLNPGERMNLDPTIVSGGVNVVTNIPSSASTCSVGGTSNVYQFDACSGSFVKSSNTVTSNGTNYYVVGQTLSNTSAAVGFIIVSLPDGETKLIATQANGSTQTISVASPNNIQAHKVGWRRVNMNNN
ncbi:MAG TPA: PilC/PilY family type IV pilus protein [Janthinobacterium sp.]|nr:PilC/PilY family type IV pilus protein [Janthinobacterium sp.]